MKTVTTKKKRLTVILLLISFAAVMASVSDVCAKNKTAKDATIAEQKLDMVPFSDAQNGYSLEFPAGWRTEKDRIVNLVAAPSESFKNPNPIPNVKVVVKPIPDGHNLDTISDTAVRQWSAIWKVDSDEHSKEGKTPTRRLILVQSIPVSIDTSQPTVQQTKVLKAFAVSKSNYYIISCAAYVDSFDKYKKTFEDIVNSLTLTAP